MFYDVTDVQSSIASAINSLGKFVLFKDQPEVYLSKLVNFYSFDEKLDLNNPLDSIVNHFSKLIDLELHEWYWSNIFQQGYTFEDFRPLFVEHIHKLIFEKISNIHLGLDSCLESLNLEDNGNGFSVYFDSKIKFLEQIFNMHRKEARLMALSALKYEDYVLFLPVLDDEIAFGSLIKFQDKSNVINRSPFAFVRLEYGEDESDKVNDEDRINEIEKELDKLKTENKNLQSQNNTLSDEAVNLTKQLKLKEDELRKATSEFQNQIKLKEDELKKLKSK